MFGELKVQFKKRIIVRRTVRSMFGEQTFAQLRTGLRRSSRKSSATRSCQRVQYFGVFKQWYGCQSLDFLTDVDTCDCTRQLHGHGKRVSTATYSVS